MRSALVATLCLTPVSAWAQVVSPLNQASVDTSALATKADAQAAKAAADDAAASAAAADAKAIAAKAVADTVATQAAALQAAMPLPSTSLPPAEQVSPTLGTSLRYRRMDDPQPRITRAANCTLTAGGVCTVTWNTPLPAAPTAVFAPVNTAGAQPIVCNPTSMPTTTGVTFKCWIMQTTTLSLAIVTTGLVLAPATAAPTGTVVQVIALPPTQ